MASPAERQQGEQKRQQARSRPQPPPPSLYRSADGEQQIRRLYDNSLASLPYPHEERLLPTSFGTAHVVVCGPADALPLVLWHGASMPAPFMLRFFDSLLLGSSTPFRIYCPDFPYHAGSRSEDADLDASKHEYGHWCLEVLQGLGLAGPAAGADGPAPFHVGVSFGAAALLDLALVAPENIRAAALVVPACFVPVRLWAITLNLILPSLLYRLLPCCGCTAKLVLSRLMGPGGHGNEETDELIKLCCRHVCRWPQIPGGQGGFTADQLRSFTSPAFVIASERDFFCPGHRAVEAAKRVLPGCRRTLVVPGARHMQSRSAVVAYNALLAEFFAEVAAGQGGKDEGDVSKDAEAAADL